MRLREAIKRASLVPAAAVIPALIVYVRIVAVKKLVVEVRRRKPCGAGGRAARGQTRGVRRPALRPGREAAGSE